VVGYFNICHSRLDPESDYLNKGSEINLPAGKGWFRITINQINPKVKLSPLLKAYTNSSKFRIFHIEILNSIPGK